MATLQLPNAFIEKLRAKAVAEGKSVEQLIVAAVEAYAAQEAAKSEKE